MSKEQIQKTDRELRGTEAREIVHRFSDAVNGFNERSESEYSMAWQLGVTHSVLIDMVYDNAKLRKALKKRTKEISKYATE